MAVTFKTKACADVTMLDASAKQVLGLIGKEFGVRVLCSHETRSAAGDAFAWTEGAQAVVRGKTGALRTWMPVPFPGRDAMR
jgi:hypothetical protein